MPTQICERGVYREMNDKAMKADGLNRLIQIKEAIARDRRRVIRSIEKNNDDSDSTDGDSDKDGG